MIVNERSIVFHAERSEIREVTNLLYHPRMNHLESKQMKIMLLRKVIKFVISKSRLKHREALSPLLI